MGIFNIGKRLGAAIAQAKANGQIPEGAGTQATISSSFGSGILRKIAKANGVAKKMNGDTSASSTISAVDRSFKKHKRNNIFGN